MRRLTAFNTINEWIPYLDYKVGDAVTYQDALFFCINSYNGQNPLDGFGTIWSDTSRFLWTPSYSSNSTSSSMGKSSSFIAGAGASFYKKNSVHPTLLSLDLTFENRSDIDTKAIIAFFDYTKGTNSFDFTLGDPYNKVIRARVISYNLTFVFKDNNSISAQIEEIA